MSTKGRSAQAVNGIQVDAAELARLRARASKLPLRQHSRARAALAGQYQSRFRGRGVDYQESRNYQPGDDIRNMDWRVTARTGRPHTKLFQEERERPVIVVLDRNPSMFFGTRGALKSVAAARIAAVLAWAAQQAGDRIGGFVFGGQEHHEIKPAGGRRGVMRLLRSLVKWMDPAVLGQEFQDQKLQGQQQESLGDALKRLRHVVRPGTLIIVISDFYHQHENVDRHLSRLRQHNDVVACQILDPIEAEALPAGHYPITDGEHVRHLNLHGDGDRLAYQKMTEQAYLPARDIFRRQGCLWLQLLTTDDPVEVLKRGLSEAMGRR